MKSANDLVMKAKSFHAEAFFQQKSAATQGRGPAVFNAAKSVSDLTASSNAAQMVMKNWQYKVELSKERLKTAREDFKIASEELAKSGEKNVNLLTEMASLNLNNVNLRHHSSPIPVFHPLIFTKHTSLYRLTMTGSAKSSNRPSRPLASCVSSGLNWYSFSSLSAISLRLLSMTPLRDSSAHMKLHWSSVVSSCPSICRTLSTPRQ